MADWEKEASMTPMMMQYREAKSQIPPDAILLFRLGDFYEMFFDDAERASRIFDLTLTKRGGTPMCGFPYHQLDMYLPRLVQSGVKGAIAEQMEDPRLAKGIVKRAITRIITPGTVVDASMLAPEKNNFLAAVHFRKGLYALSSLDLSTGEFRVTESGERDRIESEFNRMGARECVLSASLSAFWQDAAHEDSRLRLRGEMLFTECDDDFFDERSAREKLCGHFKVTSLDGFGCRELTLGVGAAGAVLAYAVENLRSDASHVLNLRSYHLDNVLEIDAISQRNLELVEPMFGSEKGSTLLSVLDHTVSPMGARLLRDWVLRPLCERDAIVARLDAVEAFKLDPLTLAELRETIAPVRDLERLVGRVNIGNANARDVQALGNSLGLLPGCRMLLGSFDVPLLGSIRSQMGEFPELVELLQRAIADEPAGPLSEGNFIRDGFNAELDELRSAAREGKNWLADIQKREQERTNIKSLKVKFNQVFGYYIEVSKSNLDLIPEDYIRKQTLVNAERFITPELKELESKILGSEEKSRALELVLFQQLREEILKYTAPIQQSARQLARVDALGSLAECARIHGYTRPHVTDSDVLEIVGGRHPVLDAKMRRDRFVPNDVLLDGDRNRMMVITGPNMAGKSTYIRQTALLVILAQMGSFVPAERAEVGMVDRIFTRVGASDDLARGQSTFMVEMVETANILNHVTPRSLVILDEIGRGTSTFDGLSIAWAVAEFLHDDPAARCRTQFATHYHELTELAQSRRGVNNYNVAVREYAGQVIFLRQIVKGGTDRSYGIHVAQLAGLPKVVIDRANSILETLEKQSGATREAMKKIPKTVTRNRRASDETDDDQEQLRLF